MLDWRSFYKFQRTMLVLMGMMYLFRGVQVLTDPHELMPSWTPPHLLIAIWIRVVLWSGIGLTAIITAYRGRTSVGFAALMVMPVERAVSYLWSAIAYFCPAIEGGSPAALAWTGWWVTFSAVIFTIASWPHIEHKIVVTKEARTSELD